MGPRTEAGRRLLAAYSVDPVMVTAIENEAARHDTSESGDIDVEQLARAMRSVMDVTTAERAVPYVDVLAREYARASSPIPP